MAKDLKTLTREEVAQHNKEDNCWIIIDSFVYDITKFIGLHPGGEYVLLNAAGTDASEKFYALHRHEILEKFGPRYIIGKIDGEKPKVKPQLPGTFSKVPHAEQAAFSGRPTPYFKESHHKLRQAVRAFYDGGMVQEAHEIDAMGEVPELEAFQKMGQAGILACRLGPGPHLKIPKALPGGVKPEEFDYFHEMIVQEETCRLGIYTYGEGMGSGMVIGLPPLLNFGTKKMKEEIVPDIVLGNKRICLAISEPDVGSDVAQLTTTAKLTPDGKHYIVNGVKKWITNGTFSDWFTTGVRTGGPGMKGISMLLIPRCEGVSTKTIKTSGSTSAGTALVMFDNVKVPVENLLGKENMGFAVIMTNFNHERWGMIVGACRGARLVAEECMKWANQRHVFGKPLIEQPVIRFKIAEMIAGIESVQGWLEQITHQMNNMSYKDQGIHLAGPLALCKFQSTRMTQKVSDNAVQIFGGRGITRTGMGRVIESFQRTNKFGAILGGSEEILADLAIRQALRAFPPGARL